MYLDADDARTDVILAAVPAVVGVLLRAFVQRSPGYPGPGTLVGALLDLAWIVALTSLVPILLARHRGDGLEAFGLRNRDGGLLVGLPLALPAVAVGIAGQLLIRGEPVLGRVATTRTGIAGVDLAVGLGHVAATSVGALVLVGFLATRAEHAFPRSPELPVRQLLRTVGTVLVGVAAVGGLLRSLGSFQALRFSGLALGGVLLVLLLADRVLDLRGVVSRATILTPLLVLLAGHVMAGRGLLGNPLQALTLTAIGGAAALAITLAARDRRGTILVVPLAVAVHWWPSCLSPLLVAQALC